METALGVAFLLLMVAGTVFWIAMLIDCAKNEPSTGSDKIVWIVVIVFTHILGALIYYFVRRRPRRLAAYHAQLQRWRMANPIAK
jgi:heme/copper-type cytochrome/quinol oxidase subunit 1